MELRPDQATFKAAIRDRLCHSRRVCAVAPTGSGKSVVLSSITHDAAVKGRRVWVLAHRRKLIQQLSKTVARWGIEHGIIRPGEPRTDHAVQVGSVDTVVRRLHQYPAPDLVIVDEAHHLCSGNKWGRVIDALSDAYLIGFTASPQRLDGRGLGEGKGGYFQELVIGPSAAWLTEQGFLARPVVYSWPTHADGTPRRRAGDFAPESSAALMDKPAIMGDVIKGYRKRLDGKTAIANCCTVKHAESTAASFRAAGINAAAITGQTSQAEQDRLFAELERGELKVLCQCELISEGVDIPSVTGALMLRHTESLVLWLQQCGRALRAKEDGGPAIIMDFVGNALRLGLPSEEREWSLDGISKAVRGAAVSVRVCGKCFASMPSTAKVCGECGAAFEVKERKGLETVNGELVEITKGPLSPDMVCVENAITFLESRQDAWAAGNGHTILNDCKAVMKQLLAEPAEYLRHYDPDDVRQFLSKKFDAGEAPTQEGLFSHLGMCNIGEAGWIFHVFRLAYVLLKAKETTGWDGSKTAEWIWPWTRELASPPPFKSERSTASTLEDLIRVGHRRGMANPAGWARHVLAARQAKRGRVMA